MSATDSLVKKATDAAKKVVESASGELIEAQKLARELSAKGIKISPEELMARKGKKATKSAKKKATKGRARKRVVLTDAQRKSLTADLQGGLKVSEAAKKYGVSEATVNNHKAAAGLTKKRK